MTVTIDLPGEIEASVIAQAAERGLAVADYLQGLVRDQVAARSGSKDSARPAHELPADEWLIQFQAWLKSNSANKIVLPNEAMEREAIYSDRGR
jgi:hypothetical protein